MSEARSHAAGSVDFPGTFGRQERLFPAKLGSSAWKFTRRKPLGALGLIVLVVMLVAAVFAERLAPYDPIDPVGIPLQGPTSEHLFGTDHLGRDVFSRILIGARPSLNTSVVVVTLALVIGSTIGAVSGYVGGNVDLLVQRLVDGFMAFPPLVLTLTIVAALETNVTFYVNTAVVAALTVALAPGNARLIRAVTMSERATAYVDASRTIGCTHVRILCRHILPNIMAQMIVIASIQLGVVILAESALSFLGYGTPPPTPTWGGMLTSSGTRFMIVAPYLAIIPGIALSLAVLSFNLFGDALRDVLDPRLRK